VVVIILKILLYTENKELLGKSGLGKAIEHQEQALLENGIDYTFDPDDDYDIVHINFYGPKSYFLAKQAKAKGKKVVYHAHSTEEDFRNSFLFSNLVSPFFRRWITDCYELGDCIITPTPYSKSLLEGYGITNKIVAISNGIDTNLYQPSQAKRRVFREKYGYKEEDKIIMGIGLYIERKGIIDFVELAKMMPEYKFIWFGYSPLITVPQNVREAVKTELPNLLFAGYVEKEEIAEAYDGADLYLNMTYEETEGMTMLEACSSKIPTLVRDIPVFNGWLEDKVNTYMANDIDEFNDLARKIINKEIPDLTEEAVKVSEERDLKIIGKKLIEVYKSVLKED
jgi:1,2-diacylglycerol-3-alpha-glucose alpha-1,2-glucosyltransferase